MFTNSAQAGHRGRRLACGEGGPEGGGGAVRERGRLGAEEPAQSVRRNLPPGYARPRRRCGTPPGLHCYLHVVRPSKPQPAHRKVLWRQTCACSSEGTAPVLGGHKPGSVASWNCPNLLNVTCISLPLMSELVLVCHIKAFNVGASPMERK